MKPRTFLNQLMREAIVAAIREAERKTSGEIRVFVSRKTIKDPVAAAEREFLTLGMERTRERNAVLIFVAPETNRFAVLGDKGIYERCGNKFWQELAAELGEDFHKDQYTGGF